MSIEEIENRVNKTKNILHKCALEGQINIGLMISDIEYLLDLYQKEKEKNKENEIDLTTVYIDGVETEKSKWRDKIKAKIEELKNPESKFYKSLFRKDEHTWSATISRILQELLKEGEENV